MKVLQVATVAQSLVFQAPALWPALRAEGATLTFAAGADGWEHRLRAHGDFRPLPLGRTPRDALRRGARRELRRLLESEDWHFVQVQTPLAAALVRALTSPQRQPVVYLCHGFHFQDGATGAAGHVYRGVERVLARRTSLLLTVAREDQRTASAWARAGRPRVARLPGAGVDLGGMPVRAAPPPPGPVRLLFIGELNRNKNPLFALEVLDALRARGVDARLSLLGTGPLAAAVADAAASRDLLGSVTLRGHVDDVASALANHDLLLAPSRREGLPRVVIEALAAGLPVLARSNRGTRELLGRDAAGLGKALTDLAPDSWADAALGLLAAEGPVLRRARRRHVEPYDVTAVVRSYLRELRSAGLLGGARVA